MAGFRFIPPMLRFNDVIRKNSFRARVAQFSGSNNYRSICSSSELKFRRSPARFIGDF
jgi:hypothetical protein